MARGETAVYGDRLPVHVAALVAREKDDHLRNLARSTRTAERVELAELMLLARSAREFEEGLGHPCLNETGANGVDPDARATQLERGGLDETDDRSLARAVLGWACSSA